MKTRMFTLVNNRATSNKMKRVEKPKRPDNQRSISQFLTYGKKDNQPEHLFITI